MLPTTPAATTERRIVFYRADGGLDDDGRPLLVDLAAALEHIGSLPFDDDGRYLAGSNDVITCSWVDHVGNPSRLRLANIRRSGLPQVEEVGNLLPLEIAERQGIADQTHISLFSREIDGIPMTIAGAVFNFNGSWGGWRRTSQLRSSGRGRGRPARRRRRTSGGGQHEQRTTRQSSHGSRSTLRRRIPKSSRPTSCPGSRRSRRGN